MTDADFLDTVAEKLGVLAAGQSIDAETASILRRYRTGTFARLVREELTSVANIDDVPDAESQQLADIVALDAAVSFGLGPDKMAELSSMATKARDSLRLVTSERPYRNTLQQTRWWGSRRAGTYNGVG